MTRMRALAIVAVATLLAAAPVWGQGKTIKVGFVNHLRGDAAVYGQSMKKGTELAVDEVNLAWAKKGMKLEVVYEDDRLAAADAQTAFLKLAESDKVAVVMGSGSSTVTLSLCPKAQEAKVVLISSISTAPGLKKCGPYFFGMMASDDAAGVEWAHIAQKLGAKEAALTYINNDYGIGVKDAFAAAFQKQGGKILVEQGHEVGATDFRAEILKIKATNPKVVFIVSHVKEGSLVLKQAKELGLNVQWVGDTALQTKEVPELAGAGAEGFVALSAGDKSTATYKNFAEKFQKKFGSEPTIWADFAYDTTMVVAKALETGATGGEGLQKAIAAVAKTYKGPSGPKALNQFNIVAEYYEASQVKDGKWVPWKK
jgi:branched-chain amino acid transport system substrate-binding protein